MELLRVASVQVESKNGEHARNLANAERFVAEAATAGAKLVLCPEFLAAGYIYEESIWEGGEPRGGATETWLATMARRHRITVGASFLEADGDEFRNTFSLFGPSGDLCGRVSKQSLPFFEGWFFAPCPLPKIIETDFGRVCVGICNDNQTSSFLRHAFESQPALILMPHSAPSPELPLLAGRLFVKHFDAQLSQVAERYALELGVPVVMSNKVGARAFTTSIPIARWLRIPLRFRGHSSIVDGDGRVLAHLSDEEGVLVADVSLAPKARRHPAPATGYWSFAPRRFGRTMGKLLVALDRMGQRAYRRSDRRRTAARRASRIDSDAATTRPR